MTTFTIDSDVLIELYRRYPKDIFPTIWSNFEALISEALVCICQFVRVEIARGTDSLIVWVDSIPNFICDVTDEEMLLAHEISNRFPGWLREMKNAGDPFIIAHAKINSHQVVSNEYPAPNAEPQNQKLPSVALREGVIVLNLLEFARVHNWTF